MATRVLVAGEDDTPRFSQRGFVPVLLARMQPKRKTAWHRRLADFVSQTGGDAVQRAQQLMAAGLEGEAVRLLCSLDLQTRLPPLPLLERAVECAEADRTLPARVVHRLRMALLDKASALLESSSFRRNLRPALAQLEQDCGLVRYRGLAHVPESARLTQAVNEQQQHFIETPAQLQVYNVGDAMRELARLTSATLLLAGMAYELELLDELPDLTPLLPLSPALQMVSQLTNATRNWLQGRTAQAVICYEQMLARMREPDRGGLDDAQFERTRSAASYVLGLREACAGIDKAEERAQLMEKTRTLRVNAWRLRAMLKLHQGDAEGAGKASRRAEILQLQDDSESHYPGAGEGMSLVACVLAGDLLGTKRLLDAMAAHATDHPGWRAMQLNGEAGYRRLSGDAAGALERIEQGLALAAPGTHVAWGYLAAEHLHVLRELQRFDTALQCAQQYAAAIESLYLATARKHVLREAALCYSAAGRHAEAIVMLDPVIARVGGQGSRGLALGVFLEARARIAIDMRSRGDFELFAERCAREYDQKNPALSAKFARLMDDARACDLAPLEAVPFERALREASYRPEADDDQLVLSRMLECVDTQDRARCALTMLLQSVDSYFGHLYGFVDGKLTALAGLPLCGAETELEQWLARWVADERAQASSAVEETATHSSPPLDTAETQSVDGATTESVDADRERAGAAAEYIDVDGRRFHPVLVLDENYEARTLAAVFASHSETSVRRRPPRRLLRKIARLLLEHHDVQGVRLGEYIAGENSNGGTIEGSH